ncbi:hypothetical protein RHMOL_Rhmol11G0210900 [Rhododendron molle]|uniref:Uncharacterized protein n=1 Tax=Rhododendron molle TaxID=49168 RepID=A0ACC0LVI1_RHOML|nr:hypothetical protein RHMOL_Rhmol11G0210900 [Rhododendron molle]
MLNQIVYGDGGGGGGGDGDGVMLVVVVMLVMVAATTTTTTKCLWSGGRVMVVMVKWWWSDGGGDGGSGSDDVEDIKNRNIGGTSFECEKQFLIEDIQKMSTERKHMVVQMKRITDWVSEFSVKDAELMDILEKNTEKL